MILQLACRVRKLIAFLVNRWLSCRLSYRSQTRRHKKNINRARTSSGIVFFLIIIWATCEFATKITRKMISEFIFVPKQKSDGFTKTHSGGVYRDKRTYNFELTGPMLLCLFVGCVRVQDAEQDRLLRSHCWRNSTLKASHRAFFRRGSERTSQAHRAKNDCWLR